VVEGVEDHRDARAPAEEQAVADAVQAVVVLHRQAAADRFGEPLEAPAEAVEARRLVAVGAADVDLDPGRQVQPQQVEDPGVVGQLGGAAPENFVSGELTR
jgi:hypothetical protein